MTGTIGVKSGMAYEPSCGPDDGVFPAGQTTRAAIVSRTVRHFFAAAEGRADVSGSFTLCPYGGCVMIRLFRHYVPNAVLLLGVLDLILLLVSGELGWIARASQLGTVPPPMVGRIPQLVSFALALEVAMISVGVYGADALQSLRYATARLIVAISLGVIFLSEPALRDGHLDRRAHLPAHPARQDAR
jgi:hypothetical protein